VTITIPSGTPLGTYYLLACADNLTKVTESNEANNCLAAASPIQVTRPDLVETTLSAPPATVVRGTGFAVTDTVLNQAAVPSGASTTRYYLSANTVKDGNDRQIGSRSVPALDVQGTSTGTVTVTVPSNMQVGTYYLLACADGGSNVTETDETNNCLASNTTVQVTTP
jgi:subtilase family serine protease